MLFNRSATPKVALLVGESTRYVIRFLDPPDSTAQTASQLVQPFVLTAEISYNARLKG